MKRSLSVLAMATLFSSMSANAALDVECILRGTCIETQKVMNHLRELQEIATNNNGNRAAGTSGHELSANYIAQQLLAANYEVKLVPFRFMKFTKHSALMAVDTVELEETKDFAVMNYSGSAEVAAKISAVDISLGAGNQSTSGCEKEDFAGFQKGSIALIQRGFCNFQDKVENAQAAGASGVVLFNQGNTADREAMFSGTLTEGDGVKIPTVAISYQKAVELLQNQESIIDLKVSAKVEQKVTHNVIAETKSGNPDNVVMVGAHLDSVPEGPGVNDNGSGSAGILEIALAMKDSKPNNKVRFAWFSAEELGLVGSTRYVESLSTAEKHKISLYINVDMIGSPNYMLSVFDGDGSKFGQKGPEGSAQIEAKFHEIYNSLGVNTVESELNGRSDYAAFSAAGIAVGGIFTGAEGVMTEEEAALFNGKAGVAYDSCYHKACDSIDNINEEAMEINSNALAAITYSFSQSVAELRSVEKSATSRLKNKVVFPKHLHCHEDVYDI